MAARTFERAAMYILFVFCRRGWAPIALRKGPKIGAGAAHLTTVSPVSGSIWAANLVVFFAQQADCRAEIDGAA